MKNFKKILSVAIASATLMAGMAFPVSADYDSCDINQDGYVDSSDLVLLRKYLNGVYSITNYNRLDTNQNLIVDSSDADCVMAKILGSSYNSWYFSRNNGSVYAFPKVSGFTPSNSSSSSESRNYVKCTYENGIPTYNTTTYTLTPSPFSLSDGTNSRVKIGENDMNPSYGPENSGLVYISGIGTGFIVGDHQIATAAHCVCNENSWYSLRINTCDSNGCITDNKLNVVEVHVPTEYIENEELDLVYRNNMYDYALITVSDDLSDHVQFALGTAYNVSAEDFARVPVYVTGYANELGLKHLYYAEGKIVDKDNSIDRLNNCTDIICYDIDTLDGDSGAPVYTITKINDQYVYTAIAVHHGGDSNYNCNWGSMITNYQLQFYKNNSNMNY